jgi:hypothetical protein
MADKELIIKLSTYRKLLDIQMKYQALLDGGVSGWEGYQHVMKTFNKEKEKE